MSVRPAVVVDQSAFAVSPSTNRRASKARRIAMSDHLPQIPIGSPHGIKYYGFAAILAHMPSFVDKMRVHSFGRLCRSVVSMSESWRDVRTFGEKPDDMGHTFTYTSRCGGVKNEFRLIVHDGRSYEVHFNGTAVVTHDRYVEDDAFDAMRTVMRFVRGKIRHLAILKLCSCPLYGDVVDEWLPRRMICRVRRLCLYGDPAPCHRKAGGPWTMPKLTTVAVMGLQPVAIAEALDQFCSHDRQLRTVDVHWTVGDVLDMNSFKLWSPLPSQVANNDRLRRLLVLATRMTWPSNEQFMRWPSLERFAPKAGLQTGTMVEVTAHTLADSLRLVADGFRHGRSLRVVACRLVAERPPIDDPTAQAKTKAIAWGDAHDWRTPENYTELASLGGALPIFTEIRAWASAVVAIIEAIRSSSTPDRSIKLMIDAGCKIFYERTAVKCLLGKVAYESLLDRPSVEIFIAAPYSTYITVVHGQLVDEEENKGE